MPPSAGDPLHLIPIGIGVLLALLSLWGSLRALRKRRLIDDIPTSKTQGVFIGFVELKGTAECARPLRSYLSESDCVYYTWTVSEHWSRTVTETYTDDKGNTRTRTRHESGWTTVASGGKQCPFFLRDDTGRLLVRPGGAKTEPLRIFDEHCGPGDPLYYGKGPAHSVMDSDHRRHFVEEAIPVGAKLYVVGRSRERKDVVAPEIAHDPDAPMFLISTRSEKQVGSGLLWKAWGFGILGFVLAAGGALVTEALKGHYARGAAVPGLAFWFSAGAYAEAWFLGWAWMVFNSLKNLRERVRQAGSLVDVQLKRRSDLIPRLVAVVGGLRDHEADVQAGVAEMRSRMLTTQSDAGGPGPRACLPRLLAIAEQYPELKAQESFLSLQKELSATEQRIALARAYANDIATFYNTRLEIVPDRWIAGLGGLKPRDLILATEFERAPVEVDLSGEPEEPDPAPPPGE